ncbi:uncharacterized protein [Nicotiana tomentosiformis]|uniref:uncharacterized protein n=1 Tax=Nicotiana tomentosiformis TaxID=4098 RepID=UPI00388C6426
MKLQVEIQQLAKAEEVSWRQKSRCLWLKEGDRNTKFFHKVANSNRRTNCIDRLKVGDDITEDQDLIRGEILEFYQQLYTENESWRPTTRLEDVATLNGEEKVWLERPFEEAEVLAVIKNCAPDKAPVGFFSPQKGVRHGDPLSPFLFIFAMEGLSKMLDKANQLHWLEDFKVLYLNLTLMIFEAISGLHMNMLKSIIYPVNSFPNLEELVEVMCCKVSSFPTTYLGLPLGARYKALATRIPLLGTIGKITHGHCSSEEISKTGN